MERQLHNGYHICSCGRIWSYKKQGFLKPKTGNYYRIAAAASVNKDKSGISACIRGKQNTCGGYHWEVVK